ncbi:syntaxin-binding protein 6 [Camelus ferus]|nr:syntaxin-binding protein 6 [Camelus ferus]
MLVSPARCFPFDHHWAFVASIRVTNKKPTQASITKVKQFEGSTSFVRRSQWMLEQLRQVNGIDPNRDSAEFDLLFENAFDQWVASTASEKCTFFQILHHTCQRYLTDRKPEFINCQSKIMGGSILRAESIRNSSVHRKDCTSSEWNCEVEASSVKVSHLQNYKAIHSAAGFLRYQAACIDGRQRCGASLAAAMSGGIVSDGALKGLMQLSNRNSILHSAADSVTSAVQKASQALNERGERLGRAEEKTEDMKNSAQQFAETAHKADHDGIIYRLRLRQAYWVGRLFCLRFAFSICSFSEMKGTSQNILRDLDTFTTITVRRGDKCSAQWTIRGDGAHLPGAAVGSNGARPQQEDSWGC